jgi:hypothetical protein
MLATLKTLIFALHCARPKYKRRNRNGIRRQIQISKVLQSTRAQEANTRMNQAYDPRNPKACRNSQTYTEPSIMEGRIHPAFQAEKATPATLQISKAPIKTAKHKSTPLILSDQSRGLN